MTSKKSFIRSGLYSLLLVVSVLYILDAMIETFIFFPERDFFQEPKDYDLDFEEASINTSDGVLLHGWFLKAPKAKQSILFFHGNAGNISHRLFKTAPLVAAGGVSVLLVDYRGFGKSSGSISKKEDLFLDAEAALKWLQEQGFSYDQITLFGESIGSVPALEMAKKYPVGKVILEAPFTSLKALAKKHYPFLPGFLANSYDYDNLKNIQQLKAPLFLIHGDRDDLCPYEMGKKLYEQAPGKKEFFTIPGAGHNDVVDKAGAMYFERILKFMLKE